MVEMNPKILGLFYLNGGARDLEKEVYIWGFFLTTQEEAWEEDLNGACKLGNHYFYELLSSLVFDFLVPSLLFYLY